MAANLIIETKASADKARKAALGLPARTMSLGLHSVLLELAELRNMISTGAPAADLNVVSRSLLEQARAGLSDQRASEEDQDVSSVLLEMLSGVSREVRAIRDLGFLTTVVSASAPTVTDDVTKGYQNGLKWLHTTGSAVYVLSNNTAGAAVWQQMMGTNAAAGQGGVAGGAEPLIGTDYLGVFDVSLALNVRATLDQIAAVAGVMLISDIAYAASWDAVTTIAPSKNAVYDKIETLQPLDAFLTSIAALGTAADKVLYTTAVNTAAETGLSAFIRTLLDDVDAVTARATLGAGTPYTHPDHTGNVTSIGDGTTTIANAVVTLAKLANLAQDQFIGRVTASTGVPETTTITAVARTVLDDVTVAAMVNTLGGASSTGSGGLVRVTSPTLVTPVLGTPASGVLTNCTGLSPAGLTSAARRQTRICRIDAPVAGDAFQVVSVPDAATLKAVRHIVSAATNVVFNIEIRAETTPFTAGTDVWTADKTATTTSAEETTFNNQPDAAKALTVTVTSVSGTPTVFLVQIEYEVN